MTSTINFANYTIKVDTDMRTKHNHYLTTGGNVMSHGTKGSATPERKPTNAPHGKVLSVDGSQFIL